MRFTVLLSRCFLITFAAAAVMSPVLADKGGKGHGKGHFKENKVEKQLKFEQRDNDFRHRGRNAGEVVRVERGNRVFYGPNAARVQGGHIRHRGMDRNGDGVITRDEWRGNDNSFAVHDRNGDGVLSGDEARAGARGRVRNNVIISDDRFRRLDLNNDGLVSRDEFRNDALFGRLDVDRNNLLTRDEFFGRIDTRRVDSFASLDRNGDALIRPNEWHGSMRDFERLDRNRDGVITRDEFFYRSRY